MQGQSRSGVFRPLVELGGFRAPVDLVVLERALEADDPDFEAWLIAKGRENLLGFSRDDILRLRRLHKSAGQAVS